MTPITQADREIVIDRATFRIRAGADHQPFCWLDLETFSQPLLIGVGADTLTDYDREVDVTGPHPSAHTRFDRLTWTARSTLWAKTYHLDVHASHVEFHAEIHGHGRLDVLRFFEVIFDRGYRQQFLPSKHLNDKGNTPPRAYSRGTPPRFEHVFSPEPNSYAKQRFWSHEYAQISVNSDMDFYGGNFPASPPLLTYAVAAQPDRQWLALGLAVRPGEHLFSEYEYVGGKEFGLNINSWGLRTVKGTLVTPRLLLVPGQTVEEAFASYVDLLHADGLISRPTRQEPTWWDRPIVCGWGHQCYQADLFRVRSPRERRPDNAAYTLCTQAAYRDILEHLDTHRVPWGTMTIDARWFLAGGRKDVDTGRWPDLRGFIDRRHRDGKRVLLWWSPFDPEGTPVSEHVRYLPDGDLQRRNRPGRSTKYGPLDPGTSLAVDTTLEAVQTRITAQLRRVLGDHDGGFNADGLKIDHVSAVPGFYGLGFPEGSTGLFGIEAAKATQTLIYQAAKTIKPDALIIGQSPNPYFADVTDMLRLGDIYTPDPASVTAEMTFRARMARIADPTWLIDTDGWPLPSRTAFRDYAKTQPGLGTPSLYYATHLDTTGEALLDDDFALLREHWSTFPR